MGLIKGSDGKERCFGGDAGHELYGQYHDEVWGKAVYDDQELFEYLILEGAQAGLSFETILKKKEGYKEVFFNYDLQKISELSDEQLEEILLNPKIVRNRLKVFSVRKNAQVFLEMQKEFGSFSTYLWNHVGNTPINNKLVDLRDKDNTNEISDKISKDLKKRGMNFVGSTIIYAYLEACGLINNHCINCHVSLK